MVLKRAGNPFRWYDLVVLGVLAIAYYLLHEPYVHHGMVWADPSWYFHFGRRIFHGAVPYRDFVYQVGPLPITLDALAQRLFGETYQSSFVAGITSKYLRVAVIYLLVRCFASPIVGVGIVGYCTFYHSWSVSHHWGTGYVDLFAHLSLLFVVLAARYEAGHRKRELFLVLGGAALALVISARQSNGMVMALVGMAVTIFFAMRGNSSFFTKRDTFLRLWAGWAGLLVLFVIVLLAFGALRPAIQQLFLDAAQKKNMSGATALAEALSGGALTHYKSDPHFTPLTGLIFFNLGPLVVVVMVLFALSGRTKRSSIAGGGVALAAIPFAYAIVHGTPYTAIDFQIDVPRVFGTVVVAFAVLSPARVRRMFGVEPELVAWILGVPLGVAFANEMSNPGRGWADGATLPIAILVIMAASTRVSHLVKASVAVCLGVTAAVLAYALYTQDADPYVAWGWGDGKMAENTVMTGNQRLRGIRYHVPRAKVLAWLTSNVQSGESCFVYGNLPILYDLLDCKNPSRLDTTAADFITGKDGEQAINALKQSPPKWIVAMEAHWMNPDLELPYKGDDGLYAGLNPAASKVMHQGLRDLLPRYELLPGSSSIMTPEEIEYCKKLGGDELHRLRLYRLKE